jgi:hypothetical protein
LDAYEHDYSPLARLNIQWDRFVADEAGEFLVNDLNDVFASADAWGHFLFKSAFLDSLGDVEDELDVYVGLEQRPLDVADQFLHCCLVNYSCTEEFFYGVGE